MKKLLPAYILSFVAAFMLCLCEPLMMYFTNIEDFWFDFHTMLPSTLIFFAIVFVALSLAFTALYFLCVKLLKQPKFYQATLLLAFGFFFVTYIQGNYLAFHLPALTGDPIVWTDYIPDMVISAVLLGIVAAVLFVAIKKLGATATIKYSSFVTAAIFVMLGLPLLTTPLSKDGFRSKDQAYATFANVNNLSADRNFLILLLDAVDSADFHKVLTAHPEYQEIFSDFTYYPDATSTYTFTRDAIPSILSGFWNHNETDYLTYYNHAIKDSDFLRQLDTAGYDINIYDYEFPIADKRIKNLAIGETAVGRKCFMKQEAKYSLFKYLPFYLKSFAKIDTLDFSLCRGETTSSINADPVVWHMPKYRQILTDLPTTKQDSKYFQFVHLEGAHVPFDLDKDLNTIEDGTYEEKIEASITLTKAYLAHLKENSAYDNSAIVIMADHGFNLYDHTHRQNPIFMAKGVDEHHDLQISDTPLSYIELTSAFSRLMDGQSASSLFSDLDPNRERIFIHNLYKYEDHMVEYMQTGPAWDKSGIAPTGKEYNR